MVLSAELWISFSLQSGKIRKYETEGICKWRYIHQKFLRYNLYGFYAAYDRRQNGMKDMEHMKQNGFRREMPWEKKEREKLEKEMRREAKRLERREKWENIIKKIES